MRTRVVILAAALAVAGCGTSSSMGTAPTVPSTSSWPSTLTPSSGGTSPSPSSSSTKPKTSSSTSTKTPTSTATKGDSEWGDEAKVKKQAKASAPAVKVASSLADSLVKHRSSSQSTWWAAIKPSLSTSGQQQMKSLGPKKVGFTKVTGKARAIVTEADMGERYVSVGVPTDEGLFVFLAEKQGKGWKVASVSRMNTPTDQGEEESSDA